MVAVLDVEMELAALAAFLAIAWGALITWGLFQTRCELDDAYMAVEKLVAKVEYLEAKVDDPFPTYSMGYVDVAGEWRSNAEEGNDE